MRNGNKSAAARAASRPGSEKGDLQALLAKLPSRLKARAVIAALESADARQDRAGPPACPEELARIASENSVDATRLLRAVLAEFLGPGKGAAMAKRRQQPRFAKPLVPPQPKPPAKAEKASDALAPDLQREHPRVIAARLKDVDTESAGRWLRSAPPVLARATALALTGMEREPRDVPTKLPVTKMRLHGS